MQILFLDRKQKELTEKINTCVKNEKTCLKNKDRDMAKAWLRREKKFKETRENYMNVMTALENNLMDLNNAEGNIKIQNTLINSSEAFKALKIDADKFAELTDNIKEKTNEMNEVNDILKNYATDDKVDYEGIDQEINELQKEIQNDISLPDANKSVEISVEDKKEDNKVGVKNDVNKNEDLSLKSKEELDKMLESLENA